MVSAPEASRHACNLRMDMAPWPLSTALCPGKGSSQLCLPWCGVSRDKREETFPRSQPGKKVAQCCGFLPPKLQVEYLGSRKACSLPVLTSAPAGETSLVISWSLFDRIALVTTLSGCLIHLKFISNAKIPA